VGAGRGFVFVGRGAFHLLWRAEAEPFPWCPPGLWWGCGSTFFPRYALMVRTVHTPRQQGRWALLRDEEPQWAPTMTIPVPAFYSFLRVSCGPWAGVMYFTSRIPPGTRAWASVCFSRFFFFFPMCSTILARKPDVVFGCFRSLSFFFF